MRLRFIEPGKPVQNPFVESFNGRFRDPKRKRTLRVYGSSEAPKADEAGLFGSTGLVRLSNVSISIGSTLAVMRVKRLPSGGITTTANVRIRH